MSRNGLRLSPSEPGDDSSLDGAPAAALSFTRTQSSDDADRARRENGTETGSLRRQRGRPRTRFSTIYREKHQLVVIGLLFLALARFPYFATFASGRGGGEVRLVQTIWRFETKRHRRFVSNQTS